MGFGEVDFVVVIFLKEEYNNKVSGEYEVDGDEVKIMYDGVFV